MSLEKLYEKWDVKYPSSYIRDFEKYERGEGLKLGVSTETPLHPYGGQLHIAKYLITLADTLDVSLDYLLGRTPCPNPEQVVFGVDHASDKPQWRTDDPPEGARVLGKFDVGEGLRPTLSVVYFHDGLYWLDKNWSLDYDLPLLGWSPIPED